MTPMQFYTVRTALDVRDRFARVASARARYAAFEGVLAPRPKNEQLTIELPDDSRFLEPLPFAWALRQGLLNGMETARRFGHVMVGCYLSLDAIRANSVDSSESAFVELGQQFITEALHLSPPYGARQANRTIGHPYTTNSLEQIPAPLAVWLTPDVLGVARAIAEDHTRAHPILADALEEAGCEDVLILEHLRTCEDHGPSCWVTTWLLQAHPPDVG